MEIRPTLTNHSGQVLDVVYRDINNEVVHFENFMSIPTYPDCTKLLQAYFKK